MEFKIKKQKGLKMQNFANLSIQRSVSSVQKIVLSIIMLFTMVYGAGVEATLSNTEIVQGNMAQLKIKATGNRAAFPNITEINGVKVLGRHESQSNSYTYINGKMSNDRATTLVLTFAPQKDMTIPSYEVNVDGTVYKTDPLQLKVVKATAPNAGGNSQFSLQLRADKKSVIVGEPLLVTVYFSLQHGVRLSENPQYNKPEFKDFFVKEVGKEKSYNEGNRQVTELRYMLIPQSEGNFTVGPATAKIGIADRTRRDMFGRFFGTTWHPIASNTIDIEVKSKPKDTDLVGNFSIDNSIDRQKVKANKPVNLTVKIMGEGSLEDFEFPTYEIDGVTIYSDDAKISTNLQGATINSTYVKSFAFISDHDFTIPARRISVYDIKSQTVKYLEIPSYDVKIEGSASVAAVKPQKMDPNSGKVQTNLKIPAKSMLDDGEPAAPLKKNKTEWWMVLLAFVSGMIVMLLVRYLRSFKMKTHVGNYSESEALKILYPHMSGSPEIEAMVRRLYAKKNGDKSVVIDKKTLNEMVEKVQH